MDTIVKTSHKINATLTMLNDFEFTESLQTVKSEFFTALKREEAICKFILATMSSPAFNFRLLRNKVDESPQRAFNSIIFL